MNVLLRDLLDVIDGNVAVIDLSGNIVAVNDAWKRFASRNGGDDGTTGVGVNYLEVCKRAGDGDGATFYEGLRSVLSAERERFRFRYPCHAPDEQRYFIGTVRRIERSHGAAVVVTHEDVTEILLEERAELERLALAKATVSASSQAILSFELGGVLIDANPAACRLFGYPVDGMLNCKYDLLFPEASTTLDALREACGGDSRERRTLNRSLSICTREIQRQIVEARIDLVELGERSILVFMLRNLGSARPARPASILVVEDDFAIRTTLVRYFFRQGYAILQATDGMDALRLYRQHHDTIGLILTDFRMPRMDGLDFLKKVRERDPTIPILFLTGEASALREQFTPDAYTKTFEKPCRLATLRDTIELLLS